MKGGRYRRTFSLCKRVKKGNEMMKKTLFLAMVLILSLSLIITFSLAGCKQEEATEETVEETTEAEEEQVEEEADEGEADAEEDVGEEMEEKEVINLVIFADILVPQMDDMFARFTADTGYPVEVEGLPGGQDWFNIVSTRLSAGEGPDILVGHGTLQEYVIFNPETNFYDMTDWVDETLVDKKVPASLVNANAFNGKSYGIPYGPITLRGYYYNKNVLEASGAELPKDCYDFLNNVAPKIRAAGFDPVYGMGQDGWGHGFEADNFVADEFATTDIQDRINKNEASFADSAYVRAYEWQLELLNRGFYNDDLLVGNYDGAVQALIDGTAFCTMMSVNTMSRYPDEANQNYLSGLFMSEGSNRAYYSLPNYAYVINETGGSDNIEGAIAFMEWFTKEENLLNYYSALKAPSAYIGIENEMWPYARELKAAFDAMDPFVFTLSASPKQTGSYSTQVVAGTLTPLEAAEQMQRDFTESAKAAGLEAYQD